MDIHILTALLIISGLGHIALSIGSLAIPKVLKWQENLKNLQPLLKQMFWTYAAYILVINLSFGVITLLATDELLNRSILAKSITLFIAVYWLARIFIQIFYFDRSQAPKGIFYTMGELLLMILFGLFTITYFIAFLYNHSWI